MKVSFTIFNKRGKKPMTLLLQVWRAQTSVILFIQGNQGFQENKESTQLWQLIRYKTASIPIHYQKKSIFRWSQLQTIWWDGLRYVVGSWPEDKKRQTQNVSIVLKCPHPHILWPLAYLVQCSSHNRWLHTTTFACFASIIPMMSFMWWR